MQPSQNCIDLIKKYEGLQLKAYQCPAKIWTIGYGTTKGVREGMTITEKMADSFLDEQLEDIAKRIMIVVKCPLTQNQLDALVSLVYNIGAPRFLTSTILYKLNKGKYDEAALQFLSWNRADGRVFRGLVNRREEERELFLKEG